MKNSKIAKGERVETLATIERRGSKCIGRMAWETPYIEFRLLDGRVVIWHSDNAAKAQQLPEGTEVALSGFLYGDRLRRVQVAKGCLVFGMAG